jgi:hypothetical protein
LVRESSTSRWVCIFFSWFMRRSMWLIRHHCKTRIQSLTLLPNIKFEQRHEMMIKCHTIVTSCKGYKDLIYADH